MSKKSIVSIIIFPGSNCDRDLKVAIERCLNVKIELVWHQTPEIKKTDMIFIPGGFSYGDYLRAGILATKSPAVKEVIRWSEKGIPIIGICNGFQILTECKLLPGTLIKNLNPKFLCKNVYLKVFPNHNFTNNYKKHVLEFPIAHSQGNYFLKKDELKLLQDNEQIVFQYSNAKGEAKSSQNPNGSILNIAGISNKSKNILGMMPHPERAIGNNNLNDGLIFFKSLGKYL